MGRFLASGILTTIYVKQRGDDWHYETDKNFDIKKEYDNLIREMNKIIDTSKYDVIKKSNGYIFNIKLEYINANIHDLLIEMDQLFKTRYLIESLYDYDTAVNIDYSSPDFKAKYPLKCSIENDEYTFRNKDNTLVEDSWFGDFSWFFNNKYFFENVIIWGDVIPLWLDYSKYVGEDEKAMLKIINNMKGSYYKSELSKCLIYLLWG